MIPFRSHRFGRIQNLLRPFRGIGNVGQQVQLAGDQHLQQLRPAALDIFIGPPGVDRNPLLIHVPVSALPPEGIRVVEGRLVPPDPHDLWLLLLCRRSSRQGYPCQQQQAKQKRNDSFQVHPPVQPSHGKPFRYSTTNFRLSNSPARSENRCRMIRSSSKGSPAKLSWSMIWGSP